MRKNKDIKIGKTESRKNYLFSEPNYYTTEFLTKNLLIIEMRKTQIPRNKPADLGLSLSK